MKTVIAITAASFIALAGANPASAFSFSPPSAKIKLTGTVTVSRQDRTHQCAATIDGLTGASGASTAKIRSVVLTADGGCVSTPANLPWTLTATGAGTATLSGLAFTIEGAPCGPATASVTVDPHGAWTIRAIMIRGGCDFGADLTSKPRITIVP
jgi:hypothetical protein